MLAPNARAQAVDIGGAHPCVVIDNALIAAEQWVDRAAHFAAEFEALPGNAYPGLELHLPEPIAIALARLLEVAALPALGLQRCVGGYVRLGLVTRSADELEPRQWICHRDQLPREPHQGVLACVLYLFDDPRFGGTAFYRPTASASETAQLVHDSGAMSADQFATHYGITPGYLTESNRWFEQTAVIAPRFNRLIAYRGEQFHTSQINDDRALSADPARGRLTLNGFWVCD
jgi:hypothetical protein